VGVSDSSSHSIGYPVIRIRYMATVFGGAMAGLAGGYFSLHITPLWADGLTAGAGWIALAVVVFSGWKPWRALLGAYLFGLMRTLELVLAATHAIDIAPQFIAMLPYLTPIVVLTLMRMRGNKYTVETPSCLGRAFKPA
jgi:simple sugar transport system permease protein